MTSLESLLTGEHAAIAALLARATAGAAFDADAFEQARALLLRHIAIEEKVLLPDARRRRGGEPLEIARTLRREHSAIASLLVPTPDAALAKELMTLLAAHDLREEGPGGVYEVCAQLAGDEVDALTARARAVAPVPMARHFDGPGTYRTAAAALAAFANK